MKFTPIFPNNKVLETNAVIPAWEITDGPVFPLLDETGWIPAHEFYIKNASEQEIEAYRGKEAYKSIPSSFLDIGKKLMVGVRDHLLSQQDYFVDNIWPKHKFNEVLNRNLRDVEDFSTVDSLIDIWRDAPHYRQSVHLDNFGILVTMVYNIKDNPENSGTKYYKNFDLDSDIRPDFGTFIHQGPTKAGTGILHINTPWAYHEGWNMSDEYREVAYWSLAW
jgi:hypothetical protein